LLRGEASKLQGRTDEGKFTSNHSAELSVKPSLDSMTEPELDKFDCWEKPRGVCMPKLNMLSKRLNLWEMRIFVFSLCRLGSGLI